MSHHTISLPVFPDVPDVADWRPGVGPPINPDPAKEAPILGNTQEAVNFRLEGVYIYLDTHMYT